MDSRLEEQKPYLVKAKVGGGVCVEVGNFGCDLFKGDHVAVEEGFVLGEHLAGQEVAFWWHRAVLLNGGFVSLRQ